MVVGVAQQALDDLVLHAQAMQVGSQPAAEGVPAMLLQACFLQGRPDDLRGQAIQGHRLILRVGKNVAAPGVTRRQAASVEILREQRNHREVAPAVTLGRPEVPVPSLLRDLDFLRVVVLPAQRPQLALVHPGYGTYSTPPPAPGSLIARE